MNPTVTPRPRIRWEMPAFFIVLAAQVALVLFSTPFPTQDLPAHLESATFGLRLLAGDAGVAEIYDWNRRPVPSWMGQIVTSTLVAFLPAEAATKALVVLGMVPLALAMWLVVGRAGGRDGQWAAMLVLPMLPNMHVHMGFFSFTLALPIVLLLAGWWVMEDGPRTWRGVSAASFLLVLLYFLHPVPAGLLLAGISLLELLGVRWGRKRGLPLAIARIAALGIPTATCVVAFAASGEASGIKYSIGIANRIGLLVFQHALDPFGNPDNSGRVVAGLLWGATALAAMLRRREAGPVRRTDGFLALGIAMAAMHIAAPQGVGLGTFFNQRTSIFAPLMMIPWIAAQPVATKWRPVVGCLAVAATMLVGARQAVGYMRLQPMVREFDEMAAQVPEGASFALVHRFNDGFLPEIAINPVANRGGLVTVRRKAVNRTSYQASSGVFPLVFRTSLLDARSLATFLTGRSAQAADYEQPDLLLLWLPPGTPALNPAAWRWIDDRYELAATTEPSGSGRVYRRRRP